MIRIRGKVVGLGLALAAGPFAAAQPPALLPPTVRGEGWTAGAAADPVWFPARTTRPTAAPPAVAKVTPPPAVRPAQAEEEATLTQSGPRTAPLVSPIGPLPVIPPLPDVPPAPPQPFPVVADAPSLPAVPSVMPALPETRPVAVQPHPAPPPRPVDPPAPMPPMPRPSPLPPPNPVPAVPPSDAPLRPQPQQDLPELPTAPPHLLVPSGYTAPLRHTAFGSDPVRISRDYPSIHDLFRFHTGAGDVGPDGDDPGASPAADRGYVRLEYLLWWVNAQRIPVLATTSTTGGFGNLGEPGTVALLGPGRFGSTFRDGFRVRGGWWCDDDGHLGVDGGFFFLGRSASTATFDPNTTPTITRPFFAPNNGGFETGERVSLPGLFRGVLNVDATSGLYGFDANVRHALCKTCGFRNEVFAGYRFLGLNESLTITETIGVLSPATGQVPGTLIVVQDRFRTTNRFNGGQLGYAAERNWGRVSLDGRASVALGNTHQTVDVSGSQVITPPGATTPTVFPNGGLLAAGPNLGRFTDDRFSVVPEVSLNLGYWVTPNLKTYVGYNALYWSNVARPGDQIDRTVDVTFVPNPPMAAAPSGQNRPMVPFRQDHLWVNGIQFGAEWRW